MNVSFVLRNVMRYNSPVLKIAVILFQADFMHCNASLHSPSLAMKKGERKLLATHILMIVIIINFKPLKKLEIGQN